jgi:hypothetical protein
MTNTSWRHHYLPVFYLKGFTNKSDKFLIFDVDKGHFIKNGQEFSPSSYFFKKDANTWIKDGEKDDFLERKFFTPFDNRISKLLDQIHSSNADNRFSVSEKDMPLLQNFVNLMYWRLPHRDKEIEKLIDSEGLKAFALSIQTKEGQQNNETKKIEKRIKQDPEFKKGLHFIMSMVDTVKMIECSTPLTIQPFVDGLPHVCSDNPVLFENEISPKVYKDDFVFPMSGNMFFIRANRTEGFSPVFKLMVDTLVFKQAVRYVSFTDERYFHSLNEFYNKHFNSVSELRSFIFRYLKTPHNNGDHA